MKALICQYRRRCGSSVSAVMLLGVYLIVFVLGVELRKDCDSNGESRVNCKYVLGKHRLGQISDLSGQPPPGTLPDLPGIPGCNRTSSCPVECGMQFANAFAGCSHDRRRRVSDYRTCSRQCEEALHTPLILISDLYRRSHTLFTQTHIASHMYNQVYYMPTR